MASLHVLGPPLIDGEMVKCPYEECNGHAKSSLAVAAPFENAMSFCCDMTATHRWYQCCICPPGRAKPLCEWNKISRHMTNHNKKRPTRDEDEGELTTELSMARNTRQRTSHGRDAETESRQSDTESTNMETNQYGVPHCTYGDALADEYFDNDKKNKAGAWIVTRALNGTDAQKDDISREEVEAQLLISDLVSRQSRGDNVLLASILKKVISLTRHDADTDNDFSLITSFPTSFNDMRRTLIRGNNSIMGLTPWPRVELVGEHSYISIRTCISHMMGHSVPFEPVTLRASPATVCTLAECHVATRYRSMLDGLEGGKDCTLLTLNEWSDDFDPNGSNKSNRGGVWIKTVTIASPHHNRNSMDNTYPIAFGPKGANHDEVECRFHDEMTVLSRPHESNVFWNPTTKRTEMFCCTTLAVLQDQPKRHSNNNMSLGNARFGAQWHHSVDISAVTENLPCCKTCMGMLLVTNKLDENCKKCLGWDTMKAIYTTPLNYPQLGQEQEANLSPFVITYTILREAVTNVNDGIVKGTMTAAQAGVYLKVHCINDETSQTIIAKAQSAKEYEAVMAAAMSNPPSRQEEADVMMQNLLVDPMEYELWKPPAVWGRDYCELDQNVDVIMHLLFLGIVKSIMAIIQTWLTQRQVNSEFERRVEQRLDDIASMNMRWCNLMSYTGGGFGGWVSENYLGFSRLLNWFYSDLPSIMSRHVYVQPTTPQSRWTKKENVAWLRARGLLQSGLAHEVKLRVMEFMRQADGPPAVLEDVTPTAMRMIESLAGMLAVLMGSEVNEEIIAKARAKILIFLSIYNEVDTFVRNAAPKSNNGPDAAPRKPSWLSKYNFMSLLNLPEIMRMFGPLRNLWEGKNQGEGILRYVKPLIMMGLRYMWNLHVMLKALKMKGLSTLLQKYGTGTGAGEDEHQQQQALTAEEQSNIQRQSLYACVFNCDITREDYFIYKTDDDATKAFEEGRALSVVQIVNLNGSIQYGCMGTGGKFYCLLLKFQASNQSTRMYVGNLYYFLWEWTGVILDNLKEHHVHMPLLLLPLLENATKDPFYCGAINNSWGEMSANGTFCCRNTVQV